MSSPPPPPSSPVPPEVSSGGSPPKVALVAMSTGETEAHGNLSLSLLSGYLNRNGVPNDLLLIVLHPSKALGSQPSMERFLDQVRKSGYSCLVFESVFWPGLTDRIRTATDAHVLTTTGDPDSRDVLPGDPRAAARRLKSLLADGPTSSPGAPTASQTPPEGAPPSFLHRRHFTPNFRWFVFCEDPSRPPAVRLHLISPPCPHRLPVRGNPLFARQADMPQVRSYHGCSYCPAADVQGSFSERRHAALILKQLTLMRRDAPEYDVFPITHPGNILRPLATALKALRPPSLEGCSFQFQIRPDVVVHRQKDIEELLSLMQAHRCTFRLAVVGFENFSAGELLLYNRGYDPDLHTRAVAVLRRLGAMYGPTFDWRGAVASFILFNPWTTVEDLRRNLHGVEQLELSSLFREVAFRKLDLRPGVPMYHKALAEGLLEPDGEGPDDLPANGYFAEVRWKFRNDATRAVWKEYAQQEGLGSPRQRPALLRGILDARHPSPR